MDHGGRMKMNRMFGTITSGRYQGEKFEIAVNGPSSEHVILKLNGEEVHRCVEINLRFAAGKNNRARLEFAEDK